MSHPARANCRLWTRLAYSAEASISTPRAPLSSLMSAPRSASSASPWPVADPDTSAAGAGTWSGTTKSRSASTSSRSVSAAAVAAAASPPGVSWTVGRAAAPAVSISVISSAPMASASVSEPGASLSLPVSLPPAPFEAAHATVSRASEKPSAASAVDGASLVCMPGYPVMSRLTWPPASMTSTLASGRVGWTTRESSADRSGSLEPSWTAVTNASSAEIIAGSVRVSAAAASWRIDSASAATYSGATSPASSWIRSSAELVVRVSVISSICSAASAVVLGVDPPVTSATSASRAVIRAPRSPSRASSTGGGTRPSSIAATMVGRSRSRT